MLNSNLVAQSATNLVNQAGIKPRTWSEDMVGALIYVVVPMAFPYAKARGGQNKSEVSLFFKGGFMSTRSKAEGRGVVHTSSPFIQFMSELPRQEGGFERKPGETQVFRISSVSEEMEDSQSVFVVEEVKPTRWRHKVTEAEESRKLRAGSRIPYNFRLELGVQTLAPLVGGATDWADQWDALKQIVPAAQPQLHLLLALGSDTHLGKAENKEVYGMEGVQAYHVTLGTENVVAAKWVMVDDDLYDQSACLPDNPVCHDEEFEDLPEASVKEKPKSVGQVLSLKDPANTLRKLWLKKLNSLQMDLHQLDEFIQGLTGDLEYWWTEKLSEEGRIEVRSKLAELKRSAKAEAKAEALRRKEEAECNEEAAGNTPKAEVQKETVAPTSQPLLNEEPEEEETKQETPAPTPTPVSPFGGMVDEFDEFDEI